MRVLAGYKKRKKKKNKKIKLFWEKLNKGWGGVVFYCILGVLVAFSVHQISGILLDTDLPIVTVSSRSMVPNLNVGDIVIIKGEDTYEAGEIIVFNGWETEPIIHRIVATSEYPEVDKLEDWNQIRDKVISEISLSNDNRKIYITKGDNNVKCDQCTGKKEVLEEEIYGKALVKIPYLGWVKILAVRWFIVEPNTGLLVLIILAGIYLVYNKITKG